jgi:hypothetical protein
MIASKERERVGQVGVGRGRGYLSRDLAIEFLGHKNRVPTITPFFYVVALDEVIWSPLLYGDGPRSTGIVEGGRNFPATLPWPGMPLRVVGSPRVTLL